MDEIDADHHGCGGTHRLDRVAPDPRLVDGTDNIDWDRLTIVKDGIEFRFTRDGQKIIL
jgi:hypothetical protein